MFFSSSHVIYLLVVDVSKPLKEIRLEIEYWMDLSQQHTSKDSTILLIGTHVDKVSKDRSEDVYYLLAAICNVYSTIRKAFLVSIHNERSVKLLVEMLSKIHTEFSQTLLVPKVYAQQLMLLDLHKHLFDLQLFASMAELENVGIWRNAIIFAHNVGHCMFYPPSDSVCLKPQMLSKLMAPFLLRTDVVEEVIEVNEGPGESSLLMKKTVELIVAVGLKQQSISATASNVKRATDMLGHLRFFIQLPKAQVFNNKELLIPSLRPSGKVYIV